MGEEAIQKEVDMTILEEAEETNKLENPIAEPQSLTPKVGKYKKWLEIGVHAFIILTSQTVATILGKMYFNKGGKSTWLSSLTQTIGFPILLPFLWSSSKQPKQQVITKPPSMMVLLSIYVFLGLLLGGGCVFLSIGLQHLPASTFSLITASQLSFNVLFSVFLKLEKMTPFMLNSVVLLTISSLLLALQPDHDDTKSSNNNNKHNYVIGIICTLVASAGFGLLLSSTDHIFRKVLKKNTLNNIMDVIICQAFFASCLIIAGLFISGDWKNLKGEMDDFKTGKVSYVMNILGTSVCWQIYTYSLLGLIMKVSALFANVITTLSEPIIPILSLIIFHEKMNGVKAISMVLAIWGFSSYAYQQALDEKKYKAEMVNGNGTSDGEENGSAD